MAGINLRRRCYSNDTLPESRILMIGTVSGSTNVYVNEDSGYSLANSKSYAQGTPIVSQGNRSYGGVVSPSGKYFFQVERYGTSLSEDRCLFFKIEDEEVTLLNTITGDDLPADIVRPTSYYATPSFGEKGECVFTKDERYLYIASTNSDTSTSTPSVYVYISKFEITDNGLVHVKTHKFGIEMGDVAYGPYLALSRDETLIAFSVIYTNSSGISCNHLHILTINDDGSLTSKKCTRLGNSFIQCLSSSVKNGRIHFSANGKWLFREYSYYNSTNGYGVGMNAYYIDSSGWSCTSLGGVCLYDSYIGCRVVGDYVYVIDQYDSDTSKGFCRRLEFAEDGTYSVRNAIYFPLSDAFAKNIANYGGDTSEDGKYFVFNSMTSSYYYLLEMNFDDSTYTLLDSYDAGISLSYMSLAKFINEEE